MDNDKRQQKDTNFIVIDKDTGEYYNPERFKKANKGKEDLFVKLYLSAFDEYNCPLEISVRFIANIARVIGYDEERDKSRNKEKKDDQIFGNLSTVNLLGDIRTNIKKRLGVNEDKLKRMIKLSADYGIIIKTNQKGVYVVNPYFIAKGCWDKIFLQRLHFIYDDINNKWLYYEEII